MRKWKVKPLRHFTRIHFLCSIKFEQLPLRQTRNYILCRQLNRNKETKKFDSPQCRVIINALEHYSNGMNYNGMEWNPVWI